MSCLKAGFARLDATPMLGIPVRGYYQVRLADGVLDPIELNALAISCGGNTAVLITLDTCAIDEDEANAFLAAASAATGLPEQNIYIHATHTHTAPFLGVDAENELVREYTAMVTRKMGDVAKMAMDDLKPAKMGWAVGQAPNIAFIRRFRMKNGKVRTNPGVGNPDILHPIGEVDERVNVLRFDREGAETIVLANFADHPDTVGGCKLTADWPGFFRRKIEKCLDNVKGIFFNGAQGDVNHVNVNAKDGDLNDMFMDFDDVSRGYGHARHMGNVVAGAVMQVYDKVNYVDVSTLKCIQKTIQLPSNMADPSELPEAHYIKDMYDAGRANELPYEAMELTTVVADACRKVSLENGPSHFPLRLSAIVLGDFAFLGIPGEPFNAVGRAIKEAEGFKMVSPCCLTNGCRGYFPTKDAYDEGGYEARASRFKAGTAELIAKEAKALLEEMHESI